MCDYALVSSQKFSLCNECTAPVGYPTQVMRSCKTKNKMLIKYCEKNYRSNILEKMFQYDRLKTFCRIGICPHSSYGFCLHLYSNSKGNILYSMNYRFQAVESWTFQQEYLWLNQ